MKSSMRLDFSKLEKFFPGLFNYEFGTKLHQKLECVPHLNYSMVGGGVFSNSARLLN